MSRRHTCSQMGDGGMFTNAGIVLQSKSSATSGFKWCIVEDFLSELDKLSSGVLFSNPQCITNWFTWSCDYLCLGAHVSSLPLVYSHHPHLISTLTKRTDCATKKNQFVESWRKKKIHPPHPWMKVAYCCSFPQSLFTCKKHCSRFITCNEVHLFV